MMRNDILREVAEVLDVAPERVTPQTTADDLEAWDSMGVMSLLFWLNTNYGVELAANETSKLTSVENICNIIQDTRAEKT